MRSRLKQLVPKRFRPAARKAYFFPVDTLNHLRGRRSPLVPPRGIANVGGGDFEEQGRRFLKHFVQIGGLRATDRVLDVGCGVGRMAVPLTRYLTREGSYEGFDIVPEEVDWCRRAISSRFPNFRFQVSDIRNTEYNPGGKYDASDYKFPYGDASFDFVMLTSVFTHLLPAEIDNYLCQISRVLKPGGRCFATFFLLNENSLASLGSGRSTIRFGRDLGGYRVKDEKTPETAVAYNETWIQDLYQKHGLQIEGPIRYGSWSGRKGTPDYQDIVLSRGSIESS